MKRGYLKNIKKHGALTEAEIKNIKIVMSVTKYLKSKYNKK